jgi:hypothetical protein
MGDIFFFCEKRVISHVIIGITFFPFLFRTHLILVSRELTFFCALLTQKLCFSSSLSFHLKPGLFCGLSLLLNHFSVELFFFSLLSELPAFF